MLGLQGVLTNPGASLGISIGNMELAIDYLSNMDSYEPELTDIKTTISNKKANRITKKPIVKPKLTREGLLNKFSLVSNNTKIEDDIAIDSESIINESDDFEFDFDTEERPDNTIKATNEYTADLLENIRNSIAVQSFSNENSIEVEDNQNMEVDEQLDLDNIQELDIDGLSELEEDTEDNEEIDFEIEGLSELEDEEDISEDEFEIDGLSELEEDTEDNEEDNELEIDIDTSLLEIEDDDEDKSDSDNSDFNIEGLDDILEEDEEESENEEINTEIKCNNQSNNSNKHTDKSSQQTIEKSNKENDLDKTTAELQKQLDEKRKQNELLRQLAEEEVKHNKLLEQSKKEESKIDAPKTEKEKSSSSKPIEKINIQSSKYDKYTVMTIDALYDCVKKFMYSKGVKRQLLDLSDLNEEFGADNIQNLIVKQYLIKTKKGVTIGR